MFDREISSSILVFTLLSSSAIFELTKGNFFAKLKEQRFIYLTKSIKVDRKFLFQ